MTFNDIFKSSFLENVTSISLLDMGIALVLAFCLGLFIFMIYKKTFSGVMYSSRKLDLKISLKVIVKTPFYFSRRSGKLRIWKMQRFCARSAARHPV